jgi:hypothetical protein
LPELIKKELVHCTHQHKKATCKEILHPVPQDRNVVVTSSKKSLKREHSSKTKDTPINISSFKTPKKKHTSASASHLPSSPTQFLHTPPTPNKSRPILSQTPVTRSSPRSLSKIATCTYPKPKVSSPKQIDTTSDISPDGKESATTGAKDRDADMLMDVSRFCLLESVERCRPTFNRID